MTGHFSPQSSSKVWPAVGSPWTAVWSRSTGAFWEGGREGGREGGGEGGKRGRGRGREGERKDEWRDKMRKKRGGGGRERHVYLRIPGYNKASR